MRLLIRILLPLLVLVGATRIAFVMVDNRPEPDRREPHVPVINVETARVESRDYTIWVQTRGTVRPRTQSMLFPEVSGRIVEVSAQMRAGEFFEIDDVLLRIDPRDYQIVVTIAESELQQARAVLAEEQARATQAERDWKRLGETGEPDALVLRKPQLGAAHAAVTGAQARLRQARLELERTVIRAPYAGRVLEQSADIGQYVTPGTPLAQVYAVDFAEVRLPLTNRQLEFVNVPEIYRTDSPENRPAGPIVRLSARIGSGQYEWKGRVVRAEGAIDTESRQLFVVALVDDPYGKRHGDQPPLKVGQFVQASIEGQTLERVFVIPRATLRVGAEVLLVGEDGRLENRPVQVVWSNAEHAVVTTGLSAGEQLVLTPLGAEMAGMKVRISGAGSEDAGAHMTQKKSRQAHQEDDS